ncbi:type II toxin-antitoxin system RelE/ParE family toxin [Pseudoxanthomonas daejeonensis]|uniref:type II toxin-antitoxin system RelE/ParE family toxin n=1 Tax=Pseudoxanthomonas daejeonensis TaxID=266062 RepID=UPI001F540EBC|nr:type II toxin-antitoxin system RelE/ParE family toxin [Pseudoxanthomonas daejeonensis]UNK56184.1 type II toxin-antitoxin system RelE/ParE family toxin [Pseudoxanthomonas daejeonensis]
MKKIEQTEDFAQWLRRLRDTRAKALITERIVRIARGLAGDVKALAGGLFEMRVHHGPGYRVYFTERSGDLVILLCGGDKGSQRSDIAKARELAKNL